MERFLVLTTSAETAESDNPPKEKRDPAGISCATGSQ